MKRIRIISVSLFALGFITTYLIMCFAIPGLMIKLDAPPGEYFIASITHMVFFKALVSIVVAIVLGIIPLLFKKKK